MQGRTLALVFSFLALGVLASADDLRLKTRTIVPEDEAKRSFLYSAEESPLRMRPLRMHWLIQVNATSQETSLEELRRRGAAVLSHVPEHAFVVSVPDSMTWEGLELPYARLLGREDKLSPLLAESLALIVESNPVSGANGVGALQGEGSEGPTAARRLLLARFHKDVEAWEADGILEAEGITAATGARWEHPVLEKEDRLLELTPAQVAALQNWDEVEYLYPAPQGMKTGEGMRTGQSFLMCGGPKVGSREEAMLEVSMLAAPVGNGWDGPGRGAAALTYSLGPLGSRLSRDTVKGEIARALAEWSRSVAVSFTETSLRTGNRNLDIVFATGEHGDPYPFASGTNVLGHTFYPAPPNPEPLGGDVHLNDAYSWSVGGDWDVFTVVLHELGHALGIGHTDDPNSVMYPYYRRATGLTATDIASIRQVYADAGGSATPAALSLSILNPAGDGQKVPAASLNLSGGLSGALAGVRVEALNETNAARLSCLVNNPLTVWSCGAISLAAGENRIAITAAQGSTSAVARRTVLREVDGDVQLAVTLPLASRVTTQAEWIDLSGKATHSSGISTVRWTTNRNQSGTANLGSGSLSSGWAARVPLLLGETEISVTATARSGISATRKVGAERTATPPAGTPGTPVIPGKDTSPPTMTMQQPVSSFVITSAKSMSFRGTARDNVGVQRVTWTNSSGNQSGLANGTTLSGTFQWNFDVNLNVGFNSIEVRVWDAAGNSSLYTATIRRY